MSQSPVNAPPAAGLRRRLARSATAVALLAFAGLPVACGDSAPSGAPSESRGGPGHSIGSQRLNAAPAFDPPEGLDAKVEAAIRSATQAVDRDPERAGAWLTLGSLLHAHRHFEVARDCYEQALLRDPASAKSWYYKALIDDQLGDTNAAEDALERVLELDAMYPPTHWRLGLLLLGRGELEGAEREMRSALAIAPEDAASVVGLARVLLQEDSDAAGLEAIDLLEAHLKRLPGDHNARFLLGTAYRNAGRMHDAARLLAGGSGAEPVRHDPWLSALQSLRQGHRAEFLEAVRKLEAGDVAAATRALESLRERQPEDTLLDLSLHRAYRAGGALDRSIELLLATRERDPLHEMVHLHLAGAFLEKAELDAPSPDPALLQLALESSARAQELSPALPGAHGMHGDVLEALGQSEAATDDYMRAAQLEPDSALWHEKAARGLCNAARWPEAVDILTRLDVLQPGSSRTLFFLGAALGNVGRLEEACAALKRAEAAAPGDASIADAHRRMREAMEAARGVPSGPSTQAGE